MEPSKHHNNTKNTNCFLPLILLSTFLLLLSLLASSTSSSQRRHHRARVPPEKPHFVESKLKVSPTSTSAVPRIAYLISGSAGDGESLKRTLKALYHPWNHYAVHLDLEASARERLELANFVTNEPLFVKFGNVRTVVKANLVTYRGPTMVANTLHAAAVLLNQARDWDWFINLSASDYPLVTQDGRNLLPLSPTHIHYFLTYLLCLFSR